MARIPMMKRVQQVRTLAGLWKHRSELFHMFREMARGTYKASFVTIVALIAAILYLFSPINILTDLIPVVGWIDDGFIIYFLLKRLMYEMERYGNARKPAPLNLISKK